MRATPRNAGFVVGIVVLAAVFAFFRPSIEASTLPKATPPTGTEANVNQTTTLPPQLSQTPSQANDNALDNLVVLDQPTDSSKPQPEKNTEPDNAADTKQTKKVTDSADEVVSKGFTIRILNGGGKSGAAAALRTELSKSSLTVASIGNAQQTYTTTTIYYQTGKRAEAESAAKILGEPAAALEENAIAKPADILIVIGTDRNK